MKGGDRMKLTRKHDHVRAKDIRCIFGFHYWENGRCARCGEKK